MLKILLIISLVFIGLFLLFFPFWHTGGHYYRGLLLIYDIRPKTSSGNFLPPLPFEKEITILWWADPTSFEYFAGGKYYSYAKDRFSVYCNQYRLNGFDPNTFYKIQAPITDEPFYVDKTNVRSYDALILKTLSPNLSSGSDDATVERFDTESFQPIGANIFKDKNGVYSYCRSGSFSEDMNQPYGKENRTIELFTKQKELDTETFKVNFCDEKTCQASDKNGNYIFKRLENNIPIVMKKIE